MRRFSFGEPGFQICYGLAVNKSLAREHLNCFLGIFFGGGGGGSVPSGSFILSISGSLPAPFLKQ